MKKIYFSASIKIVILIFLICGFRQGDPDSSRTVRIGDQVWMAENLDVSVFRNGDQITEARSAEEWVRAGREGKPAWCYYENNLKNGSEYGKLYNWYAVSDPRGLAPKGWKIPTDRDWIYLTDFLGGDDYCGILIKSKDGWIKGGNGNNHSGFNALPAGSRNFRGEFQYAGELAYWWTTTPADNELAWYRTIDKSPYYVYRLSYSRLNGFSVRCIKE